MTKSHNTDYFHYQYDKLAAQEATFKARWALAKFTEYYPELERDKNEIYFRCMADSCKEKRLQLRSLIEELEKESFIVKIIKKFRRE